MTASFVFFDNLAFKKDVAEYPTSWSALLAGHGNAPEQYRLGVLFPSGWLTRYAHGHFALRYSFSLLDCLFLIAGLWAIYVLLTRNRLHLESGPLLKGATQFLTIALLLYYVSWTFWYHKPETIANFASIALAALLLSGYLSLPAWLSCVGLVAVSTFLATIRADSGFVLNFGILIAAFFSGNRSLPIGRINQIVAGIVGLFVVFGIEYYIKHVLYPTNPFSDPLISIVQNLTSPLSLFCVVIALLPFFFLLFLVRRSWNDLETWQCALVVASIADFAIFFIVAHAREVRVFLPYPLALSSTAAAVFCRYLVNDPSLLESSRDEAA